MSTTEIPRNAPFWKVISTTSTNQPIELCVNEEGLRDLLDDWRSNYGCTYFTLRFYAPV